MLNKTVRLRALTVAALRGCVQRITQINKASQLPEPQPSCRGSSQELGAAGRSGSNPFLSDRNSCPGFIKQLLELCPVNDLYSPSQNWNLIILIPILEVRKLTHSLDTQGYWTVGGGLEPSPVWVPKLWYLCCRSLTTFLKYLAEDSEKRC